MKLMQLTYPMFRKIEVVVSVNFIKVSKPRFTIIMNMINSNFDYDNLKFCHRRLNLLKSRSLNRSLIGQVSFYEEMLILFHDYDVYDYCDDYDDYNQMMILKIMMIM